VLNGEKALFMREKPMFRGKSLNGGPESLPLRQSSAGYDFGQGQKKISHNEKNRPVENLCEKFQPFL
jgi:hypothetical protein